MGLPGFFLLFHHHPLLHRLHLPYLSHRLLPPSITSIPKPASSRGLEFRDPQPFLCHDTCENRLVIWMYHFGRYAFKQPCANSPWLSQHVASIDIGSCIKPWLHCGEFGMSASRCIGYRVHCCFLDVMKTLNSRNIGPCMSDFSMCHYLFYLFRRLSSYAAGLFNIISPSIAIIDLVSWTFGLLLQCYGWRIFSDCHNVDLFAIPQLHRPTHLIESLGWRDFIYFSLRRFRCLDTTPVQFWNSILVKARFGALWRRIP